MTSGISNATFWDAVCLTVLFAIVGTLIAQCSRKIAQLDSRLRQSESDNLQLQQANRALTRELGTVRIQVRDTETEVRSMTRPAPPVRHTDHVHYARRDN